jgi:cytochrome c oxidase subunit II
MFAGPSNTAGKINEAFVLIVAVCIGLLLIVTFFMILFLIKYNKKKHPQHEVVKENTTLEVIWTVIPTILVAFMFYLGWVDFEYVRNPPPDAKQIHVIAQQWQWLFQYENGKQSDVLKVPAGVPIKLLMTSRDVIHSLYIPAFRIKEDCVPGLQTHLWFTAEETGSYDLFCTEYCGVGHSHMRSKVEVMPSGDFKKWYEEKAGELENKGLAMLKGKGCLACHTTDGSAKVGPTFLGLFGKKISVTTNGKEHSIVADETYIQSSITHPKADIVKGYPAVMPQTPMKDEEIQSIIDYLKSLK